MVHPVLLHHNSTKMIKCTKIDCFEGHDDDITKLHQLQSTNPQNEVSTTIINSARLTPDKVQSQASSGRTGEASRSRAQFKNCNEKEQYQFLPTAQYLIYTNSAHILAIKPFTFARDEESSFCKPIQTFSVHEKPILHMATSFEGWLLCTCSEDSIILWKWDSLLRNWDHYRIGVGMSRTTAVAICHKDKRIYITTGHPTELIAIECVNGDDLNSVGLLNLVSISKYAVLDKQTEVNTWLANVFLGDVLHVVGFSSNRGVSIKVWQVSDKTIKLKYRAPLQIKTLASADVLLNNDTLASFYAIGTSVDGQAEIFHGCASALTLINRIKIEEPQTSEEANGVSPDIEFRQFRVISTKFFVMNKETASAPAAANDSTTLPELDNSLAFPKPPVNWCPKLHVVVASTKGISIVNIRSGDCEHQLNYSEVDAIGSIVVSNIQLAVNFEENEVVAAFQPLLQNSIVTFRVVFDKSEEFVNTDEVPLPLSLISTEPACAKSVLRKKLRSPSRISPIAKTKTRPSGYRYSASRSSPSSRSASSATRKSSEFQEFDTTMVLRMNNASDTARTSKSSSSTEVYAYNSKADMLFNEGTTQRFKIETKMSDALSYMRMAFTGDGNYLATCGNVSPLVIHKVNPKCQSIGTYRDSAKASSVGFSFSSKYMILALNDGKTSVIKWQNGFKLILSLEFASKFNEHVHAQFYYMDKFILQPEDNRIALYSCRIDEGGPVQKLKAGSFVTNCQSITALAGANQLYSNLIFYAGSNKSLNVFDANVEKCRWTANNAHSKNINCIRLNEAPKGSQAMSVCDYILTGSLPAPDPIKIWDLRVAKCAVKIADNNINILATNFTRPALSPCGRYICSAFEEQSIAVYDIRKINSRLTTFRGLKSSILDTAFDPQRPMLWAGCKNGSLWNFIPELDG